MCPSKSSSTMSVTTRPQSSSWAAGQRAEMNLVVQQICILKIRAAASRHGSSTNQESECWSTLQCRSVHWRLGVVLSSSGCCPGHFMPTQWRWTRSFLPVHSPIIEETIPIAVAIAEATCSGSTPMTLRAWRLLRWWFLWRAFALLVSSPFFMSSIKSITIESDQVVSQASNLRAWSAF